MGEIINIDSLYGELMINSQGSKDSKLLEMAIKRYQFDVVGWTEYCIDNKILSIRKYQFIARSP